MLKISQVLVNKLLTQAKEHFPIECCGLLAGTHRGDCVEVAELYPMTNIDQSPEHFSMNPKEQFAAVRDMRQRGLKLLGNYHSHPATPARPSQEDIRLAYDPQAIYIIVSLAGEPPALKAFRIANEQYAEIPLTIEN